MKFSGVEKNPQIDDAYLLMGKACFYSQDYNAALATFNLLIAQYKDKKESYEPMIWLAFTNSRMGNYS
jgi:TolA-binding protein